MVKAKVNNEDLIGAAIKYCELIRDICNKRIQEKYILVEVKQKEKLVDMYKMKEGKVFETRFKNVKRDLLYPEFVDIEVLDFEKVEDSQINSKNMKLKPKVIKYIPLLFYDDLLECMLQNLESLKDFEGNILDPSFLLEQKIIIISNVDGFPSDQYTWEKNFDEIDLDAILKSIDPTFPIRF